MHIRASTYTELIVRMRKEGTINSKIEGYGTKSIQIILSPMVIGGSGLISMQSMNRSIFGEFTGTLHKSHESPDPEGLKTPSRSIFAMQKSGTVSV